MALPKATWRNHSFEIGQVYTAKKSFSGHPNCQFVEHRVYVLDHIAYSRYDSATVFAFHVQDKADQLNWIWSDDQPDSFPYEYFDCDSWSMSRTIEMEEAVTISFLHILADSSKKRTWYSLDRALSRLGTAGKYNVAKAVDLFIQKGLVESYPGDSPAMPLLRLSGKGNAILQQMTGTNKFKL